MHAIYHTPKAILGALFQRRDPVMAAAMRAQVAWAAWAAWAGG
jgi:hypothetical protein